MGKRAHGEGTITQRKDGTWMGQVSVGYKADGSRDRRTVYGKTQKDVRAKLDRIKQQLAAGTLSDTKLTVKDYLEYWLQEKSRQVSPRTMAIYGDETIRPHIIPYIGRVRLDRLTPMKVQAMVSDIADTIGIRTANICRTVLFSALKQAVRWQLVPRNVVEAVDTLKEQPRQQVIWSIEETTQFLDAARGHRLYALFPLAIATGLRKGELLNLRWDDLNGSTLTVRKSKTPKGVRRVALFPNVLEVLEEHRKRQEAEKSYLGKLWKDPGLIFPSEVGTKISPRNLTRTSHMLLRKSGVRHATIHDLRHLNVSLRRKQGQDAKLIADQIGHTNANFTTHLYTHIFEDDRENSAVDLSKILGLNTPPEDEEEK